MPRQPERVSVREILAEQPTLTIQKVQIRSPSSILSRGGFRSDGDVLPDSGSGSNHVEDGILCNLHSISIGVVPAI